MEHQRIPIAREAGEPIVIGRGSGPGHGRARRGATRGGASDANHEELVPAKDIGRAASPSCEIHLGVGRPFARMPTG